MIDLAGSCLAHLSRCSHCKFCWIVLIRIPWQCGHHERFEDDGKAKARSRESQGMYSPAFTISKPILERSTLHNSEISEFSMGNADSGTSVSAPCLVKCPPDWRSRASTKERTFQRYILLPETQTVVTKTNLDQTLTRAKFEELNMDLFKKTVLPQLIIPLFKPIGSPENCRRTPVSSLKPQR